MLGLVAPERAREGVLRQELVVEEDLPRYLRQIAAS